MDTARRERLKEIFESTLERRPDQRAAFLERSCDGDSTLRAELEELLQTHGEAWAFLEEITSGLDAAWPENRVAKDSQAAEIAPGSLVGPYKVLEQIGEGGFGVGYLAEQAVPVRRRVALKVIKLGMDTRDVIARFEAERQASP
jgi:hypothetical protein